MKTTLSCANYQSNLVQLCFLLLFDLMICASLLPTFFVPIAPLFHSFAISHLFLNMFLHISSPSLPSLLLCHFLALHRSNSVTSASFTSNDFPAIVDSACTIAATGDIDDFKPSSYTAAQNITLCGISAGLTVAGIENLNWTFHNHKNEWVTLHLHAIHVPGLHICLLLPQQIFWLPLWAIPIATLVVHPG